MTDHSTASTEPLPPIVSVDAALAHGNVVFCDVRWYLDRRPGHAAYLEGHIPGAIFVELDEHLAYLPTKSGGRHPMPSAASFAASLSTLGIGPDDTVVAYDDSHGMSAGRLVWMLRITGHDAALLDGGLQAWTGELEAGHRRRPPVFHPIRPWPEGVIVDANHASAAGDSSQLALVDSRAPERYRGEVEPVDPQAGHVPGAINLPFSGNITTDGVFHEPDELRRRFQEAGISDAEDAVFYCGSGVSACNNLLAVEHAGLGRAKLYAGSWSQWSNDPDRPVSVG
ncbi:MAG: sulfurtransferase [Actinomycetota bacterium]|jgi:thiosulfate/3-mercaptopyruvate sulfurtransferase|nr:sulfurtransferase [Actinomycetota bacterium]